MRGNIYLVGFMGCGKSTVGEQLAIYQGKKFQDIDELIIKETKKPIATLFEEYGEHYFRTLESKILFKTHKSKASVIATGGGIIENMENREFLKRQKVIYLKWSFETLYARIEGDARRPLAKDYDTLHKLYKKRQGWYEEVATEAVNCEGHTPYSLAKYLTERMK